MCGCAGARKLMFECDTKCKMFPTCARTKTPTYDYFTIWNSLRDVIYEIVILLLLEEWGGRFYLNLENLETNTISLM